MATLDGMQLFGNSGHPTSGGAFLLNRASKVTLSGSAPDGWSVEVKTGGKYLVASNPKSFAGYEETQEAAFKAAQQGLDLFSIARSADLGIRDAKTENITWWPETAEQVLRLTCVLPISISLQMTVVVTEDGKIKVPPSITWHASLRYFRLSQITDDLFDAYRNLFLALESILDWIDPQTVNAAGKPEPEGVWLKRALTVAGTRVPLASFAPLGSTNPQEDLFNELYVSIRTALFHAKGSRPSFLPHAPGTHNETVVAAVERLSRLFVALAAKELGTRTPMGAFTYAGFDIMTTHLKNRLRLQVADSAAPSQSDTVVLNPNRGLAVDLQTRHAPELEKPGIRSFLGTAKAEEIGNLSRLAVMTARADDKLIAYGKVEGELVLGGVDRLEGQVNIRLQNALLPKEHFAS